VFSRRLQTTCKKDSIRFRRRQERGHPGLVFASVDEVALEDLIGFLEKGEEAISSRGISWMVGHLQRAGDAAGR